MPIHVIVLMLKFPSEFY